MSAVPPRPAGAGVYITEVVAALAATTSVKLDLVAASGDAGPWARRAPGAAVHAVVPGARPLRLAWEQARAPALAHRLGADLWHGPHYTLPLRASGPKVVTVHDLTFFDHPEWHERSKVAWFRRMIPAAVGRASVVVCVSARTASRLWDLFRPQTPVVVVPHGVDHARFRPEGAGDARILDALGVRAPFVAFVGTVEPRKDVACLVRAFARLAPAHPDLTLVVAGQPGWGSEDVDRAVVDSGLGARIVRPGYVEPAAVPALYRSAAAVVYAPRQEGFGLPALEALACGAVLLTTEDSPMADMAGDAALLVRAGDAAGLAEALASALAGGPEVTRLRRAGPERARPYTWAACAQGHVGAYRLALSGTG